MTLTSVEKGFDVDMIFKYPQHVFNGIKHGILLIKIKCIGFAETLTELFEPCFTKRHCTKNEVFH